MPIVYLYVTVVIMKISFPSPISHARAGVFDGVLQLSLLVSSILQSTLSYSNCPERKVSAAILGYDFDGFYLLSVGTNGTPGGNKILPLYLHKRQCIHAEDRAIRNLPKDFRRYSVVSCSSLAPCYRCARKLYDLGIRAHVYISEYDDQTGVDYLLNKDVAVYRLDSNRLIAVHPDIRLLSNQLHCMQDDGREPS